MSDMAVGIDRSEKREKRGGIVVASMFLSPACSVYIGFSAVVNRLFREEQAMINSGRLADTMIQEASAPELNYRAYVN